MIISSTAMARAGQSARPSAGVSIRMTIPSSSTAKLIQSSKNLSSATDRIARVPGAENLFQSQ